MPSVWFRRRQICGEVRFESGDMIVPSLDLSVSEFERERSSRETTKEIVYEQILKLFP